MTLPRLFNRDFRNKYARYLEPDALFKRVSAFSPSSVDTTVESLVQAAINGHSAREEHLNEFGFAVLDEQAIEALRPLAPLLEVGAGTGYWSMELRRAGIDVIATEPFPPGRPDSKNNYSFRKCWMPDIEEMTAVDAIRKYPHRNLLTVWPDYAAPWTSEMLKTFSGEWIAYVGEGAGGCTGDDAFHEHLGDNYEEMSTIPLPQFYGLHDDLRLFRHISVPAVIATSGRHFRE